MSLSYLKSCINRTLYAEAQAHYYTSKVIFSFFGSPQCTPVSFPQSPTVLPCIYMYIYIYITPEDLSLSQI